MKATLLYVFGFHFPIMVPYHWSYQDQSVLPATVTQLVLFAAAAAVDFLGVFTKMST